MKGETRVLCNLDTMISYDSSWKQSFFIFKNSFPYILVLLAL